MPLHTVTSDAWSDLGTSTLRVRTVEPSPAVWVVAATAAPEGPEPLSTAECELLDASKRETNIGDGNPATRVYARVRGRGLVNRLIVSARKDGL